MKNNGIKNYYLHSSAEDLSSITLPERIETYSNHKFINVVNWAKMVQLVGDDELGSADIEDIVARTLQDELSALERKDVPKKLFTGKRMN